METSEIVLLFLLSTTPLPRYSFHLASTRDLRLEVSNHFEALKGCSPVKIRKQKNILSERLGIFHWLQRLNLGPILAWRIPWTEEPGRLQSMGLDCKELDTTEQLHIPEACGQPYITSS